ncbi:hypothetical protein [Phytoactinopolyspora limicola]|uniref:hypothetical protein n=1 Tax=Phytoactinopolyspora limicola TaxID=2715536 RepID=UPI0014073547|nr:hypothetical protein [Phytoactinopolyspora limicola]
MVNDSSGKTQYEVDVVALAAGRRRQDRGPVVRAIGEAKDSDRVRGIADLVRLDRVRSLLTGRGVDGSMKLLLFGRSGFDSALRSVSASDMTSSW